MLIHTGPNVPIRAGWRLSTFRGPYLVQILIVPSALVSIRRKTGHLPRLHVTISLPFGLVMTDVIAFLCTCAGPPLSGLASNTLQLQRLPSSSPAMTAPSPRLKAGLERVLATLWPEKVCST